MYDSEIEDHFPSAATREKNIMKNKTKRIVILLAAILILGIVGTYVYQRVYLYVSKPIVDYGTDVDINDYLSTDVALPSVTVIDIIYQFQEEYDFYMKDTDEQMDHKKGDG